MDLDQAQAHAIAAWNRFDSEVTDELMRAVAGAFAVIACADGELADREVERFVEVVIQSDLLPGVDKAHVETLFRDLCQALFSDIDDGRRRAFDAVRKVQGDSAKAELVVHAARVAVVADERLRAPEENALREICETLGLNPDEY